MGSHYKSYSKYGGISRDKRTCERSPQSISKKVVSTGSKTDKKVADSASFLDKDNKKETGENKNTRELNLFYANIQGLGNKKLKNKLKWLENQATEANTGLICLTETHLSLCKNNCNNCENCITDSEIQIKKFKVERSDRKNRKKGGCCIYIKEEMESQVLARTSNGYVELLMIKLPKLKVIVTTIYRPPQTPSEKFQEALTTIKNTLNSEDAPAPSIVIVGDFNFPFLKYKRIGNNTYTQTNGQGTKEDKTQVKMLLSLADEFALTQEISENTRQNSCLDLMFTNNKKMINNITVSPTLMSDHNTIEVSTTLLYKSPNIRPTTSINNWENLNFHSDKVNWESLKSEIKNINWKEEFRDKNSEDMFDNMDGCVRNICEKSVPRRRIRGKRTQHERTLRALFRKRRRLNLKKI